MIKRQQLQDKSVLLWTEGGMRRTLLERDALTIVVVEGVAAGDGAGARAGGDGAVQLLQQVQVFLGQGVHARGGLGRVVAGPWIFGASAQAGPLFERRSRHHVAL